MRFFLLLFLTSAQLQAQGDVVDLFDGRTLHGWLCVGEGQGQYFADNGVLVCPAEESGNLFTQKEYSNFDLSFEFRFEEGSNNGVGIRAPLGKDIHYKGMEIQILDERAPRYRGILKPAQYHGSLYGVFPARPGALKRPGGWNGQRIVADHRKIRVVVNGITVLEADLDSVKDPEILARHPG
jgi:hypothetical protein